MDVVRIGEQRFLVAIVILQRQFHHHIVAIFRDVERLVQRVLQRVQLLHELGDAAGVVESLRRAVDLVFKNDLFPNDYQLQEMYAQIVYDKCAEEGFDFDEQYEIQYLISLNNEKDLVDCEDDLRKEGFLVRRTPEEDFYDEDFDLYFLTLTIEHTSNIGIERLKYNTKTIINIISKYDGNLENWNVLGDEYENQ
jgi:hypothetical protein